MQSVLKRSSANEAFGTQVIVEHAGDEVPPMPGQTAGSVAPLRLLVVDDNDDAAQTLAMPLQLKGHVAITAHDGQSALRAAADQHPDFVFLDIGLPDMSGHEVALQLRRQVRGPQPVLVALTGWGGEEDRQRSREAGFDSHLTKPVSIEQVEAALAIRHA